MSIDTAALRHQFIVWQLPPTYMGVTTLDLLDEIDRLRAENGRLRKAYGLIRSMTPECALITDPNTEEAVKERFLEEADALVNHKETT